MMLVVLEARKSETGPSLGDLVPSEDLLSASKMAPSDFVLMWQKGRGTGSSIPFIRTLTPCVRAMT